MSWDATLNEITEIKNCLECGHQLDKPRREESEIAWWNYTHNVAPMIYDALKTAGIELAEKESWWQHLSGMTGTDGRKYLDAIICQLENDPARYRAMNPPNGWGLLRRPQRRARRTPRNARRRTRGRDRHRMARFRVT